MTCHEQLLANDLTTDTPAEELLTADEVSYTKKDSPLYIELHRHLFDSAEDAHDELNHFFTNLKTIEIDGFLAMPPHEHLLYLILHAYKHFVQSGIGLRQFCDIGLWARTYHAEINWKLLHDQCASVHAATFAATAFRIARDYLGIEFSLPAPWDTSVDVEPLLHDTLCGGVYGSNDYTRLHSSTVTLNAIKASRTGEKSSVPQCSPSGSIWNTATPISKSIHICCPWRGCSVSHTTPVKSSPIQTTAPPALSSLQRNALS